MTEELEQLLKNLKLRRILEIYDEQFFQADGGALPAASHHHNASLADRSTAAGAAGRGSPPDACDRRRIGRHARVKRPLSSVTTPRAGKWNEAAPSSLYYGFPAPPD
jgi:hypothetical protein